MRQLFRILVMGLMGAFIGCGGDSDSPTGPTKGPDGQTLEVYNGEDGDGNRIVYQFYRDGNDLVKHGFYKVYHSDGRVLWERNYVDGKLEGKSVRYYEPKVLSLFVQTPKDNLNTSCRKPGAPSGSK